MKFIKYYIFSLFLLIIACTVKPQKIQYGVDICHFCKMTIVDKTHAAEIVTKKGRAYMFDAIECMLLDIDKRKENTIQFTLVTDYSKPSTLIDAENAVFLISKEIKSPMGANLSAFSKASDILVSSGKQYNWKQINDHIN